MIKQYNQFVVCWICLESGEGKRFHRQISNYIVVCFFWTNYKLERSSYVKLKDWMSNSVDPDETAHNEPSHLDLRCLQKPIIIAYGSKRVKHVLA